MKNKTEFLTSIAKKILDVNPNASLTGTLMLKLRGIDLGREPSDIDILICDYSPNIIFPKDMEVESIKNASDGSDSRFEYHEDGHKVIIDVLSDGEEPEMVDGVRLGAVKGLMRAKYNYSLQDNDSAKKHHDDLVKLGFEFPKEDSNIFGVL